MNSDVKRNQVYLLRLLLERPEKIIENMPLFDVILGDLDLYSETIKVLQGATSVGLETIKQKIKNNYGITEIPSPVLIDRIIETQIDYLLKVKFAEEVNANIQVNALQFFRNVKDIIQKYENHVLSYIEHIPFAQAEYIQQREHPILYTGYPSIDEKYPIYHKEYVIIGGRPGKGKTTLALNLILRILSTYYRDDYKLFISGNKPRIVFISLEMASYLIKNMMIKIIEQLKEEFPSINEREMLKQVFIYGLDIPNNVGQYIDKIYTYIEKIKPDIVVVDYLQLCKLTNSKKVSHEDMKEVSRIMVHMKQISTVIALSQLTRDVDKRKKSVFLLSDLKESSALEADADKVIMLALEDSAYTSYLYLNFQKNRYGVGGPTALLVLEFQKDKHYISELKEGGYQP